jgi:ketosteroid isomerase-like protein
MTTNNDGGDRPALSDAEKLSIAERFAAASRTNDADAYRALCAPDAVTWHNFDDAEVTTEQTVRTVAWLHRTVPDLAWTDVAFHLTPTGWVSQTVMTGTAPGGQLRVHSCVIVTLGEDGLVTRVEEYLDPTQTAVLRG